MTGKSVLVVTVLHLLAFAAGQEGVARDDLIQDSVRRLLGVKKPETVPARNASLPPQFVMDLYEKYRSGRSPMLGNTVRSILPIKDSMGEGDVYIFNLSRIHPDEQILQGKLFLQKRTKPKSGKKRDHNFRIKIGNLPQMTSHRYVNVSMSHKTKKSHWHWYDLTDSVIQSRQGLLGVTLEMKRSKRTYRLVHFRRLLKHNSQPFILIYSDLVSNQTRSPAKTNPQNGIESLFRTKVERDLISNEDYSSDDSSEDYPFQERRKRSIHGAPDIHSATTLVRKKASKSKIKLLLSFLNSETAQNISDFKVRSDVNIQKIVSSNSSRVVQEFLSQILNSSNMNELEDVLSSIPNEFFKNFVEKVFRNVLNISELTSDTSNNADMYKLLKVLVRSDLLFKRLAEKIGQWTQDTQKSQRAKRSISSSSSNSKESKELKDTGNTFQTISDKISEKSITQELSFKETSDDISTRKAVGEENELNSNRTIGDNPVVRDSKIVGDKTVRKGLSSSKKAHRRHRHRSRTRGRHKGKSRRHRKLPFWWTRHVDKFHSSIRKNMCQRKSLVVDFTKLGWGEWVMSPKSFNAYYCSGACDFPLTKATSPSNHAAIQSLVHALGRSPGVPAPCCVPAHTSPLTMLYFDEDGNLVLKSYKDMVVDTCACR